MFHRSKNTTIHGGTFVVNNHWHKNTFASDPEDDYRRIRLGDINILKLISEVELLEDRATRLKKRHGQANTVKVVVGLQKTYHAKIFGSTDIFTVIAYEGDLTQWRRKLSPEVIWNTSLVQLFGVTNSPRAHALIYHNELILAALVIENAPTHLGKELLMYSLGGQLWVIALIYFRL
ncbi:hypothetical protein HMN09_00140100 [Mycena chlorophos]|uniref:Uncharacterized protein n=1 Tax=Mycena chlorophos TaxID=658473 RepID=A0A8H6TPS6_MYCCL|nr:hypothetical protein HMN09_00140100 [Mycena chlorophos]